MEMLDCYFTPRKDTTSATICVNCGKEKMLHTVGIGIKANKVVIITQEQRKEAEQNYLEDLAFEDDIEEESEVLGYQCLACGNIQNINNGFGCDVCLGHCLDHWYS